MLTTLLFPRRQRPFSIQSMLLLHFAHLNPLIATTVNIVLCAEIIGLNRTKRILASLLVGLSWRWREWSVGLVDKSPDNCSLVPTLVH